MTDASSQPATVPPTHSEREVVNTLFALGREVMAVLDTDELLSKVPLLIARLIDFEAMAVYLLDPKRGELSIAYATGYPESASTLRFKVGEGLVGASVAEGLPLIVNDVLADPRYVEAVRGSRSELVVPLRRKGRVSGALNLLSPRPNQFTERDADILRQFGAHVAVALENAKLFERERDYAAMLETLGEVGREMAGILDLEGLLARLGSLVKRLIDYRTFGIVLMNEAAGQLEMKLAVQYGEATTVPPVKLGAGVVGYAALHKEAVLVDDVDADPRYIKVVEDVRSELAVPLLVKDRCIGVLDLESPELNAFDKKDVEILTLLAAHAAVAIENARLYETIRANEARLEREVRFAKRVQAALLPTELPRRLRGIDVAARFAPARGVGGDLHDFLAPEPNMLVVAVGDVSGKGVPAALYSAFAGELVRSRTFRRRYQPERSTPAQVLAAINTILYERQLEEYYCTLSYALFDLKRRIVTLANSGLPYPVFRGAQGCRQLELSGVPLGSFPGSVYDELTLELHPGDLIVFCTDGVFEAHNGEGAEFGAARLVDVVAAVGDQPAKAVADAVAHAVEAFRGDTPPNDDMTIVAIRLTH